MFSAMFITIAHVCLLAIVYGTQSVHVQCAAVCCVCCGSVGRDSGQ